VADILQYFNNIYKAIVGHSFWSIQLGGNNIFWVIILAFLSYYLFRILTSYQKKIVARAKNITKKTKHSFDDSIVDFIEKTHPLFILAALFVIALNLNLVSFPNKVESLVHSLFLSILTIQVGFWLEHYFQDLVLNILVPRGEVAALSSAVIFFNYLSQFIVWSLVCIAVLDLWGVNVTTLITGLGIGGVAVALAIQNILGDLLSSFSILLDKPFEVGDFITLGGESGTVERVGIKTTRLRSITGEQVIVSNSDLLKSRIHNFKRMYERRVVFKLGIKYDTPLEKIKLVPSIVKEIIEGLENLRFERAHLYGISQLAFDFEVVYFVLDKDYTVFMDLQQQLNLTLLERLKNDQIALAQGELNPSPTTPSIV
jgi:small-conductance mechanosensitive channel